MDNILLDVRMGSYLMGDEFEIYAPMPIRIQAHGTDPVARVDVIKDGQIVYSNSPGRPEVELEYTDRAGSPGRHYYYVRLQQANGMLAWSSPFFLEYK